MTMSTNNHKALHGNPLLSGPPFHVPLVCLSTTCPNVNGPLTCSWRCHAFPGRVVQWIYHAGAREHVVPTTLFLACVCLHLHKCNTCFATVKKGCPELLQPHVGSSWAPGL